MERKPHFGQLKYYANEKGHVGSAPNNVQRKPYRYS
jgi:hypothetical protein